MLNASRKTPIRIEKAHLTATFCLLGQIDPQYMLNAARDVLIFFGIGQNYTKTN